MRPCSLRSLHRVCSLLYHFRASGSFVYVEWLLGRFGAFGLVSFYPLMPIDGDESSPSLLSKNIVLSGLSASKVAMALRPVQLMTSRCSQVDVLSQRFVALLCIF